MRLKTTILIALFAAPASHADTFNPNDHAGLCAQMAQSHNWTDTSDGVANCPCSIAALQDQMTPEIFEITMRWQIDPATLRHNLPDGMTIDSFYDTVAPVFGTVEQTCGPMR